MGNRTKEDIENMIWESHMTRHKRVGSGLRLELFNKNTKCYYCGCQTSLNEEQTMRTLRKKEKLKANTATIEHLYDRFDIRRYDVSIPFEERFVLACYGCNQKKQREQYLLIREEERKYLSVSGRERPRGLPRGLMYVDIILRNAIQAGL